MAISSDVIFADKDRNREEIHKIWETCFGDEAELVDFYLDKRMTEDNMLLICQDGHAVSMASFLDINVRSMYIQWQRSRNTVAEVMQGKS